MEQLKQLNLQKKQSSLQKTRQSPQKPQNLLEQYKLDYKQNKISDTCLSADTDRQLKHNMYSTGGYSSNRDHKVGLQIDLQHEEDDGQQINNQLGGDESPYKQPKYFSQRRKINKPKLGGLTIEIGPNPYEKNKKKK